VRILSILHDRSAGGSERIALALAGEWRRQGLNAQLLLACDDGPATLPADVPVHRLDVPRRRSFTSRFRLGAPLREAVEALRPDIVFLPGNWHFALARGVARAHPRPIIVAKLSNPPVPDLPPPVTPIGVRAFRALVAPVDCLAHWPASLAPVLRRLAPSLALEAIPNPPLTVAPQRRPARPPTRRNTVLVAGRLVPQKNVGLALDSFALAAAQRELRLIIAGDGPDRGMLEARAAALGLADRVRFIGHLPGLMTPLAGADVLLVTSRYEGTPAVVLEALATGVPVVATNCSPYLEELITGPGRGRIVSRASAAMLSTALVQQLADPRPVDLSAGELEPFTLNRVAASYGALFARLLGARQSRLGLAVSAARKAG
jgi:glycosyltransferase involved in cell wall biosynthesis